MKEEIRLKVNLEIPLNNEFQEKYKLKADKVFLEGLIPIKVEVSGTAIFYLGKKSIEDFDLEHFFLKNKTLSIWDENKNTLKSENLIFNDFKSFILDKLNDSINQGEFDSQILEKSTKKNAKRTVTLADLASSNHRESPINFNQKDHNWNPTGKLDENPDKIIPLFYAIDLHSRDTVGEFTNIANACKALGGLNSGSVLHCLRGDRKSVEGYTFVFADVQSKDVINWVRENQK